MNNDLISREALKKKFERLVDETIPYGGVAVNDMRELIDNAPSVNVKDQIAGAYNEGYMCGNKEAEKARPQGEWIKITKNGTIPVEYICSVCGRKIFDNYELSVPQSVYYPFCHCGADMRGGVV